MWLPGMRGPRIEGAANTPSGQWHSGPTALFVQLLFTASSSPGLSPRMWLPGRIERVQGLGCCRVWLVQPHQAHFKFDDALLGWVSAG